MTESIRTWETDDWGIAVDVLAIESWEGLDAIARFFRKRFRAAYVDDVEGRDTRVIVLRIRGKEVRLVHNELLGNEFYSRDPSAESLILELADAVKEAIDVGTLRDPFDEEQVLKPKTINIVCAHPIMVCWVIGAMVLNVGGLVLLTLDLSTFSLLFRPTVAIWLLLGLVPSTILGLFVGVIISAPAVSCICRRINGAPFAVGDEALVLVGSHKGKETTVYEITIGQGGQPVLKLDLGPEMKASYKDLFDESSVLKIRKGDQSSAHVRNSPSKIRQD